MRTVNGLASFGILLAILIVSAEEAKGQGILQRLQQRVQARRFSPPYQAPAQPQPNNQTPTEQNPEKGANTAPTNAGPTPAGPVAAAKGSGPAAALGPANLANPKPSAPGAAKAAGTAKSGQTNSLQPNSAAATNATPAAKSPMPAVTNPKPAPAAANASSIVTAGESILENGADEKQTATSSNKGRPTLGIDVSERTERDGLEVVGFKPESKATLVGLREGDVILSMNGRPVTVIGEAAEVLSSTEIGRNVRLEIERSGTNLVVHVPVVVRGSMPEGPSQPELAPQLQAPSQSQHPSQQVAQASPQSSGMGVEDLGINGDTVKGVRGIKIDSVAPGSPAALAGFVPGDRLVSIDGRLLINVNTLDREMNRFEPGKSVSAQVVRDGQLVQTRVELKPKSQWPDSSELAESPAPAEAKKGGSLNGLGSMIGGLFSGKSTSKKPESASAATSPKENATKQASSEVDPMELNDEPIAKAGFEKPIEIEDPAIIDEMDFNEEFEAPKALESVTPPPTEKEDPIQSEIERLEQRLNELKAKAAKKG